MKDTYFYSHRGTNISFKIENRAKGNLQSTPEWCIHCKELKEQDTWQPYSTKKQAIDVAKHLIEKYVNNLEESQNQQKK